MFVYLVSLEKVASSSSIVRAPLNCVPLMKSVGVELTPTFIFNQKSDDKIVSAAPYDDFKKKIDGLLK